MSRGTPRIACWVALLLSSACLAQDRERNWIDPDDGCLDLSNFIDDPRGFVPLVSPITEPTLGYGAVVAPIFIQPNGTTSSGERIRPNLATVGGFATNQDSSGWFGAWSAAWLDGRLETKAAVLGVDLSLDFYGAGGAVAPGLSSLSYEMDTKGGLLEARYQIGETDWMLGLRYLYLDSQSTFRFQLPIGVRAAELDSTLAGPALIASYDTRDHFFTPGSGNFFELSTTFHDPAFGASSNHQRYDFVGIHFRPLHEQLTFGINGRLSATTGDTLFYALPYVQLRGVPALRYQGKLAASVETELRWQLWNRFSLVGFGGIGGAGDSLSDFGDTIVAGGGGFRYELARRHHLHMGCDIGFSKEDTAFYVVFGSAWLRP